MSRRRALTGAAGVGVGLPVLAACGGGGTTATDPTPSSAPTNSAPPTSAPTASGATEAAPGGAVASTSDVPVGGGLIVSERGVVITQPAEGEFKGFSSTCTHQGCTVREVAETIDCACHSSSFAIDTGEPVSGPASAPLSEVPLTIDGDQIALA